MAIACDAENPLPASAAGSGRKPSGLARRARRIARNWVAASLTPAGKASGNGNRKAEKREQGICGRGPVSQDSARDGCLKAPSRTRRKAVSRCRTISDACSTVAPSEAEPCSEQDSSPAWQEICAEAAGQLIDRFGNVVHDVVADAGGELALLPVGAPSLQARVSAGDLPDDAEVTVRVFRFFEDRTDEAFAWEKELQNVNSGSLLWVLAHLQPKMHSVSGAKYGSWFTVHHIRVRVGHFKSGYHMSEEGSCALAKTFGATTNVTRLVTGEDLPSGYFWFVSPNRCEKSSADPEVLAEHGWQHVSREGPFDGAEFLQAWAKADSSVDELRLQEVLKTFS